MSFKRAIYRQPSLYLLLFTLFIPQLHSHSSQVLTVRRPSSTFTISSNTPQLTYELDYPQGFDAKLELIPGEKEYTTFCEATFDKVETNVAISGLIPHQGEHLYDNIVSDANYFYALDSLDLNIIAIKGFQDPNARPIVIPSQFSNQDPATRSETFLIYDKDHGILFIITKDMLLSYSLMDFYQGVSTNGSVGRISKKSDKFESFNGITWVAYYRSNLYVIAENVVHVYFCAENGDIAPVAHFNQTFFGSTNLINIVDLSFEGDFLFLLDNTNGVFVVDISKSEQQIFKPLGLKLQVKKGAIIEAAGTSLNIIISSTKTTFLHEYAITKQQGGDISFEINRQSEVYQSVLDMTSDDTFLYIITGNFNIVLRHSVPAEFIQHALEDTLFDFWPQVRITAMTTANREAGPGLVMLHELFLSFVTFEKKPLLVCDMQFVPAGKYIVHLSVKETTCEKKAASAADDFYTICETKQDINLIVGADASTLGDVTVSYHASIGLVIGIGGLVVLFFVFCYLFRKYKKQSEALRSKIKFKKIGKNPSGNRDEYSHNKDDESGEKGEQKGSKAVGKPGPNFQSWEPENKRKSQNELDDMKPLDFDQIYADVK